MIVNQGEILGIAGIAGNGQTELMDALTGEWTDRNAGLSIMLHRDDQQDIELGRAGPAERRKAGSGLCQKSVMAMPRSVSSACRKMPSHNPSY